MQSGKANETSSLYIESKHFPLPAELYTPTMQAATRTLTEEWMDVPFLEWIYIGPDDCIVEWRNLQGQLICLETWEGPDVWAARQAEGELPAPARFYLRIQVSCRVRKKFYT